MRNVRFCLAVVFVLFCLSAQAAGTRLTLWEAKSAQGTVYLFGSVHVCNAACFPLPAAVLKRLDASKALVVELDPQSEAVQEKLLSEAMLPAGQALSDGMSAAQWKEIVAASISVGLPSEILAPMKPWMADMMLGIAAAQKAGFDATQGIDLSLMQRASDHSLPLEELETADVQINALSSGSSAEQIDSLKLTVSQIRSGAMSKYMNSLIAAWRGGDVQTIDRMTRETMTVAQIKTLIEQRNLGMSDKIVRSMADGRTRFVVVGAAHLVGNTGVPALLQKRGYQVRQLTTDD